jgi:hypothetical protein
VRKREKKRCDVCKRERGGERSEKREGRTGYGTRKGNEKGETRNEK